MSALGQQRGLRVRHRVFTARLAVAVVDDQHAGQFGFGFGHRRWNIPEHILEIALCMI